MKWLRKFLEWLRPAPKITPERWRAFWQYDGEPRAGREMIAEDIGLIIPYGAWPTIWLDDLPPELARQIFGDGVFDNCYRKDVSDATASEIDFIEVIVPGLSDVPPQDPK